MTGPVFPTLPQPASMRATDGMDVDTGSGRKEWRENGESSPTAPKSPSMRDPAELKSSLGIHSNGTLKVAGGGQGSLMSPTGKERAREQRQQERRVARASRPPTKPSAKESSAGGGGTKDDGARSAVSAKKYAKLKKRLGKTSVDMNVELDPSGRFTRSTQVLGKGSSKVVYKGFDRHQGMEIAWNQVKIPGNLTPRAKARLLNEIEVLKRLKHKSIMKFYTSWIDAEQHHLNFITEYFNPGPLRRHRRAHKCLPRIVLKRWAWQILQGLVYLHGHQPPIIHRDLKCDNIFIHGVTGEVKIGDLGLAKLMEEGLSTCQSVLGTPEFMAPELYHGIYNEKVDIYAYGMCLLELVSMQFPYMECKNRAQIFRHVSMGIHPASLSKIEDTECREFIELCINHFHERRPFSRQLVKHSFFDDIRQEKPSPPLTNHIPLRKGDHPKPPKSEKIRRKRKFEIHRREVMPHNTKLKLELNMVSGDSTKLFMFQFDLETDTVDAVASELQEEFGLNTDETLQFTDLLTGEIGNRLDEERRDTMRDIKASLGPLEGFAEGNIDEGEVLRAVKDVEDLSEDPSDGGEDMEKQQDVQKWPPAHTERDIDESPQAEGLSPCGTYGGLSPVTSDPYGDDCGAYDPAARQGVANNPFAQGVPHDTYGENGLEYSPTPCRTGKNNPFSATDGGDPCSPGMEKKNDLFSGGVSSPVADDYGSSMGMNMNRGYDVDKQYGYTKQSGPPSAQYMDRMTPSPTSEPYSGAFDGNNGLKAYRGAPDPMPVRVPVHQDSPSTRGYGGEDSSFCTSFCGGMKNAWNSVFGPKHTAPPPVVMPRQPGVGNVARPVGDYNSRFKKTGSLAHLVGTRANKSKGRSRPSRR